MNWNSLTTTEQISQIDKESADKPVLIYKHSTRCGISSTALDRLERRWEEKNEALVKPYFLDLLAYREVSNELARHYQVQHESPQVLLIRNGKCVYSASHMEISVPAILSHIVG